MWTFKSLSFIFYTVNLMIIVILDLSGVFGSPYYITLRNSPTLQKLLT